MTKKDDVECQTDVVLRGKDSSGDPGSGRIGRGELKERPKESCTVSKSCNR